MKKYLLSTIVLLSFQTLLAQPANDNPCGAIAIPVIETADPCTPQTYDITGATYLNLTIPNACNFSKPDVWYTLTPIRNSVNIKLISTTVQMQFFTSTSCNGTFSQRYNCISDNISGIALTAGTLYYLRISSTTNSPDFSFKLCFSTGYPAADNKVGINTNTPTANLDVRGNVIFKDSTNFRGHTKAADLEVDYLRMRYGFGDIPGRNKLLISNDVFGNATWGDLNSIWPQSWTLSGNNTYCNNTGNVGIGTSNPVAKLNIVGDEYVDGKLQIRNDYNTGHYGMIQHTGNGGNFHLDTYGGGGIFLNWFSGSGLNIGNGAGGPVCSFYNNGDALLTGTLTKNSDARLKKNIQPLTTSLTDLIQLTGYTYNWKDARKNPEQQIGILAQEVQKIYPQLVKTSAEGTLSVNYMGLIPVMIESIKEQQRQIEKLVQQNVKQGKQIEELKKEFKN